MLQQRQQLITSMQKCLQRAIQKTQWLKISSSEITRASLFLQQGEMGTYATVIIGCMLAAAGIMLRTKKENAE